MRIRMALEVWVKWLCSTAVAIAVGVASSAVADDPLRTVREFETRGMERFRANQIAGSIGDFERAAKLEPGIAPQLWQLGISYYYQGEFEKGRRQFETHQRVNPHDVENAAWHFLCVAKIDGIEAAREQLLKIDVARDIRIPMTEIYKFYAGRTPADKVLAAAKKADTERARMYAHLYLGLYFEVDKKVEQARVHMQNAAAAKLKNNYMHDVAKVHLLQRKWGR